MYMDLIYMGSRKRQDLRKEELVPLLSALIFQCPPLSLTWVFIIETNQNLHTIYDWDGGRAATGTQHESWRSELQSLSLGSQLPALLHLRDFWVPLYLTNSV